jgi:glycosyltransferase involved in cell wall biosynthesis
VRIVQLNLAADPALRDPEHLLEMYHTLTGWSGALAGAGAAVHVVQRFSTTARLTRGGVLYDLVADGSPGTPSPWTVFSQVATAIDRAGADVIHVNGLMFPGMVRRVRATNRRAVIVLQDHSGALPRRGPLPLRIVQARRWRHAFQVADACSFTARRLVERWLPFGLPADMRVLEIPEASTSLHAMSRHESRMETQMHGDPCVLWVGRLDRNKDPMTMLAGLERALPALPEAHVWILAPEGGRRDEVQRRIDAAATLRRRVTIIGPVAHRDMAAYYSSADIFVSASHHEGSGYALIEAMACGVVPCVTDIPSFRALTGGCGSLWPVDDSEAFAAALCELAGSGLPTKSAATRRRFDGGLSWRVIGRQTFDAYTDLVEARRTPP